MRKINIPDRILLLFAVILASIQVVTGIDGLSSISTICFTIGFGVLIVAGLLIFISGFEMMETSYLSIISSVIPLSLSAGLISEFYPYLQNVYLVIATLALFIILLSRYFFPAKLALAILIMTHAISGCIIVLLPLLACFHNWVSWIFCQVSLGGAVIGMYGILLSFAKSEKPVMQQDKLIALFPLVFLLAAGFFVIGFSSI